MSSSQDLATILARRGALTVGEAVRACGAAARALGEAERKGQCHGDVCPKAIQLSGRGEFTLTGFGSNPAGTREYLSPERISGGPADLRADLYALGCTLFTLIVGRLPSAPGASLLDQAPGTDASVADLVTKLTAQDPLGRPSCAAIVAAFDLLDKRVSLSPSPLEDGSTRGGRTAFLAATARNNTTMTQNEMPSLEQLPLSVQRAIKWGFAILLFAAAVAWLWMVLP